MRDQNSGPKGRRFKSCHLDQKTAGNLRISGFFLCNLHKGVSLVPFPCNYFATFPNVPKGRKDQYVVVLQFLTTIYSYFQKISHTILRIVDFHQTIGYNKGTEIYESERAK